jgi:hypothetical protein
MAIITTDPKESWDQHRQKTNLLSEKVGDVDTLATPVTDTVVNAINSLNSAVNASDKRLFVFALAITE